MPSRAIFFRIGASAGVGGIVLHQEGQPIEVGGGIKVVNLQAHGGFHVNGGIHLAGRHGVWFPV